MHLLSNKLSISCHIYQDKDIFRTHVQGLRKPHGYGILELDKQWLVKKLDRRKTMRHTKHSAYLSDHDNYQSLASGIVVTKQHTKKIALQKITLIDELLIELSDFLSVADEDIYRCANNVRHKINALKRKIRER